MARTALSCASTEVDQGLSQCPLLIGGCPLALGAKAPTIRLLDVEGVAELLRTSERQVRELVYQRRIPYTKVGRLLRFDRRAVLAWLDDHTKQPQKR